MQVYTNRIGLAYRQSRLMRTHVSVRKAGLLLLAVILLVFGIAGKQDERDAQSMAQEFSPALRKSVVSSWTTNHQPIPDVSEGRQIAAH